MNQFNKILLIFTIIIILVSCGKPQTAKKDVIVEAIPIVVVYPAYPRQAALDKIEGEVSIAFTVTTEGTVKDPKIYASSPTKIFDREALRAILKYKFVPKSINKIPVVSEVTQTIKFKLAE